MVSSRNCFPFAKSMAMTLAYAAALVLPCEYSSSSASDQCHVSLVSRGLSSPGLCGRRPRLAARTCITSGSSSKRSRFMSVMSGKQDAYFFCVDGTVGRGPPSVFARGPEPTGVHPVCHDQMPFLALAFLTFAASFFQCVSFWSTPSDSMEFTCNLLQPGFWHPCAVK